jgi:hypothetical protein
VNYIGNETSYIMIPCYTDKITTDSLTCQVSRRRLLTENTRFLKNLQQNSTVYFLYSIKRIQFARLSGLDWVSCSPIFSSLSWILIGHSSPLWCVYSLPLPWNLPFPAWLTSTLKTDGECSSETLLTTYQITWYTTEQTCEGKARHLRNTISKWKALPWKSELR